jgi:WXG100 family type VII secretion target
MAEQVQANYDSLNQLQQRFAQLANDVQEMEGRIRRQEGTLRQGGWVGRGSQAFFTEMEDLVIPAIGRLQNALEEGGQVLGRVASLFAEAEDEAQGGFTA